jgi:Domain of unknown function (DUF4390)
LLAFVLTSFLFAAAAPAEPVIDHLAASASNGEINVHFSLSRAFDREQTIQSLQSGVPTSLTYVVEVFRRRPLWFDEGVSRSRIEVIATFNSVTREYLMNYRRDRKLVRSETFSDLAALQHAMTNIDEPKLFDIGKRAPHKLVVRVKADLMKGWVLYFIPWEVSTRWKEARVEAPQSEAARETR